MDIENFIVERDSKKKEPIIERWTTPIPINLKEQLNKFSKDKRLKIHESTRRFLNHLISVYSDDAEKSA